MEKKMYTIPEAARATDIPEEELRRAIGDGLILARFFQNTGEYCVEHDELARYVKRSRRMKTRAWVRKRKVLIIGEELLFAGTLKLELKRDPRLDVKFVSWGKDAIMMVNHYGAELFIVDLMPSKVAPDEIISTIRQRENPSGSKVLVTTNHPREVVRTFPLMESRLAALGADDYVRKSAGMRDVIVRLYQMLGLETTTQPLRRHA